MQRLNLSSLQLHLTRLLTQGTEKKVFAGATAAIVAGSGANRRRVIAAAGVTRLDNTGVAVGAETFFDLASLTKPLATALGILLLVDQGVLHLKSRLVDVCAYPASADKKGITIAHLLAHASGLAPYKEYYRRFPPAATCTHRPELLAAILKDPLLYPTGTDCRYSDLGFMLLGEILEQACSMPLDVFFRQNIARPLTLKKDLFFRPLNTKGCGDKNEKMKKRFAATENCPWRQRILQGEVHDEHCYLLGGIAGHAGLFGTVSGVCTLCTAILDAWQGRPTPLTISRKTLAKALRPQYPDSSWCLGFDTPSPTGYSSGGRYLARQSIGHLGYTGTSFWIDPLREIILVLLTNRVHPSRENKKIRDFRPMFHDQVLSFILQDS